MTVATNPGIRVLARVDKGDGCWIYAGTPSQEYGQVWDSERQNSMPAHVAVFELTFGPVPEGCVVHHRCERKRCVRPSHLELWTSAEHNSHHHIKDACVHGHPYSPSNTKIRVGAHGRQKICRTCEREGDRRRRRQRKELAAASA